MTSITQDTQLMDNYIASNVPDVQEFAGVYDENYVPMLFYIDVGDQCLYLIYQDPSNGQNKEKINLSTQLGLKEAVVHLQAVQSQTLNICLIFATRTGVANKAELLIFPPFPPQQFKQSSIGQPLKPPESNIIDPKYIMMTPLTNDSVYPHIAVITNDQNVYQPVVDLQQSSWTWDPDWAFPPDPVQIVDLVFAVTEGLPSIWVLENDRVRGLDNFTLKGYGYIFGGIHTRVASTPSGVSANSALSVLLSSGALHDLLVLGNGLYHFENSQFNNDNATAVQLSDHPLFEKVEQATIHQNGPNIRLWFESHSTGFAVADTNSGTMSFCPLSWTILQNATLQDLQVTPFTSNHQAGRYSALVAPTSTSQSHDQLFMYADTNNQIQVAAQSTTGLWDAAPSHFSIPYVQQIMTLRTYTTNIKLSEAANVSANHKVTITSSDLASPFINGIKYNLSASAGASAEIKISPNSNLIIIHETTDLTVPELSVQIDEMPLITLDPTTQVNEKLYQLGTVDSLANASVQDEFGKTGKLLDGSLATSTQIETAAKNIKGLQSRAGLISKGPNVVDTTVSVDPLWGWVSQAAKDIISLDPLVIVLDEIVIHFSNNKFVRIAIQTLQDVSRAGYAILQWLGVAWDKIKAFFGALFDWKAIMAQQTVINAQLTRAAGYAQEVADGAIDALIARVDSFMENLEDQLTSSLSVLPQGTNDEFTANLASSNPSGTNANDFSSSSKGSMILHALLYGNTSGDEQPRMVTPNDQSTNPIANIVNNSKQWLGGTDRLAAIWADVKVQLDKPAGVGPFIQIFKDFIALVLDLVRLIIDDVLKLVKLSVDSIFKAITEPIEIPVLGPLLQWVYELVNGQALDMPSIVGIISFILAIITVEVKALSGLALDYDAVSCLPAQAEMVTTVANWITGSNVNIGPSEDIFLASVSREPDQMRVELAEPATESEDPIMHQNWMNYSRACAGVHPATMFLQAFLSVPMNVGRLIVATVDNEIIRDPAKMSVALFERIDYCLALLDIAFACPPFEKRPDIAYLYAGFGIQALGAIVASQGGFFADGKGVMLVLASVEAATAMAKLGLYAKSLSSQLNDLNMADWADDTQREIDDIEKAIGDVMCSGAKAIGKWFIYLGAFMDNEDTPFVVAGGGILNILASFADFGVDAARGHKELQDLKGVYAPICK